ncbi:MAG: DNA polymerase III subunit alpha [Candidatus Pacebacteria bacterium]|nr:DNA polymerase III subunit alpha [Candidatus Paceibacterota bacterium]
MDPITNPTDSLNQQERTGPQFAHLHTHSHYSLLDGMSQVDAMVKLAKEHGQTAIGLTDHGVMYGAIDFYTKCKKNGIKPIIGVEAYVANRSHLQKEAQIDNKRYHLTLLAENNTGYQNLIKLTTIAHTEGYYYKPRVDKELLRKHAEGVICLSGCPGSELGRAIQHGDKEKAEEIVLEYQSIFGKDNYYLEIMNHPDVEFYEDWKDTIVGFSKKFNIPLVATQDSHYLRKEDAEAHKTLVAISTHTDVSDPALFSGQGEYHFLSTEEAVEKFKDIPEAVTNTQLVADRCNVDLTLGKFIFPDFPLEPGKTADEMLDDLTKKGMIERGMENNAEAEERRKYELEIIKNKGYSPYFLVVADLLNFAHQNQIYTTVRGSAAGSFVAYLSRITSVDPIEFLLPFERFLNPFRPSAPDIDMDFADNRRQEIVEYAKKKYGEDKVAQIGTFGTMLARGSVRDVARALGKSYETGDRLAKLIPMGSQGFPMTIDRAMELEPELKKAYEQDSEAHHIIDIAKKLEGTVRHVSVHAAGVVISPKPLVEYVPIQFDPKEGTHLITQYDMYTVGEDGVGLLKLDVLGIRNLAILENAVRLVKIHQNIDIDIEKIPFDDKKTFAMLASGGTEGVFQLGGSAGMTKYLMELKPTTIYDINAMVALYRPGPINNIPEYIARKQGRSRITYFHPKAEKFLAKSYGILVYQDDLLFTAMELAGYNWESVDKFRKAVGKKIPAEMAKQHVIFVEGCQSHSGMTAQQAEEIWNLFEPFQGYGFNKAHAACYGRVAYQTAYMKAHYSAEYMCAILTAESGDTERVAQVIEECQKMKIPVLPPEINSSYKDFTVIKGKNSPTGKDQIRFGLLTIKNLGENIANAIIAERKDNGPFTDIENFVTRVKNKDLNKKSMEALIKCGALDSFGERNLLLMNIENLLTYAHDIQKSQGMSQASLFGNDMSVLPSLKLISATAAKNSEKLMWEKELLGLFVSAHPLHEYAKNMKLEKTITIKEVRPKMSGPIKIGGIVTKVQKIITKTGKPMLFAWIEDLTSKIEVVVFPTILEKYPEIFKENAIIVVAGKVNDKDGLAKLLCDDARHVATLA